MMVLNAQCAGLGTLCKMEKAYSNEATMYCYKIERDFVLVTKKWRVRLFMPSRMIIITGLILYLITSENFKMQTFSYNKEIIMF